MYPKANQGRITVVYPYGLQYNESYSLSCSGACISLFVCLFVGLV